ncbi:type II toxin-antitoxin system VapC family toxin [Candidatus Magnetaquicoccus inordinatus]|uniref:type II toxin-antitoxin system VapC family toxin n=1 Tax=Candidatus Magnetaquicoccus inordinatus TaxID=2496818 RepID=UPI00102C87D3|nr:type II toxin-antitoxin system VapC family toxin [Candidatus Magnetaquicoccus inordinatus]
MKPRLYLETSIVSYLAAMPSRDLVVAAHQQITHEWWAERRCQYELFVSTLVIQEMSMGDQNAAQRRLSLVEAIPVLTINDEVILLGEQLQKHAMLPTKADADALHIALAAFHRIDFLLTWNCRHIANGKTRRAIDEALKTQGMVSPIIVTPEELPEEN